MQTPLFLSSLIIIADLISNTSYGAQRTTRTQTSQEQHGSPKKSRSIGTQTVPSTLSPHAVHTATTSVPKANPNEKDFQGNTRLHVAASAGNNLLIQKIIKQGAVIDAENFDSETPLYRALQNKKLVTAKLLVTLGADINKRIGFGYTLLLCAIDKRDSATAQNIINFEGTNLAAQTLICLNSALHLAVVYDLDAVVDALLEAAAPLDLPDYKGQTPIYRAIAHSKTHLALRLVDAGASLTHQDHDGLTPEAFAKKHYHFNVAKTLADIHATRIGRK